jgi:bisphosphoglycerate-independent phosphoglycerate mutase (AlkP superfamily)
MSSLTFTSPSATAFRAPHLHNTCPETCRTQGFRQGRVSHHSTYFVDHIDNHSSQNEHTRVLVNLMFANPLLLGFTSILLHWCFF